MSDIAIRVENLSKKYKIGAAQERQDTLRDWIVSRLRRRSHNAQDEILWALKDVSFEVKSGEVLGIIGRNGAGKSTLLKILSRITEPTSGMALINGKVGSLLEVGTGFHLELTGRENIYLSGTILGMRKNEIDSKFDEIVDFSGVERFIDTPIKRYSSGMNVRLGFAVAAHMEPEILIVDEVLAVGDARFQKRCLNKMDEIGKLGRTVVFVSHSLPMIGRLCEKAILLDCGTIVSTGIVSDVIADYAGMNQQHPESREWIEIDSAPGDEIAKIKSICVSDTSGDRVPSVNIDEPVFIDIEYWNLQSRLRPTAIIHLINDDGITVLASNDFSNKHWWATPREPGLVKARCKIPGSFLAEGRFTVLVAIGSYNPNMIHALIQESVSFQVIDKTDGSGVRGEYSGSSWPGVVRPLLDWSVSSESLDDNVNRMD